MTNIILCGCSGRMGEAVSRLVADRADAKIIAGIDINTSAAAQVSPAAMETPEP